MLFPEVAKDLIAKTFYDDNVEVYRNVVAYDEEGGKKKAELSLKCTLKGNSCPVTFEEKQAEKGIVLEADVRITCDPSSDVEVDDVLKIDEIYYTAIAVLPYDSHKTILGKRVKV